MSASRPNIGRSDGFRFIPKADIKPTSYSLCRSYALVIGLLELSNENENSTTMSKLIKRGVLSKILLIALRELGFLTEHSHRAKHTRQARPTMLKKSMSPSRP